MDTRCKDEVADVAIVFLSFVSALNACLFRSEQIDHLISPTGTHNFSNSLLSLTNALAVTPEVLYNLKRNVHLQEPWKEVMEEVEKNKENISENKQASLSGKSAWLGRPILFAAALVAVGHFVIFYDANAKMFREKYDIRDIANTNEYGIWPKFLSIVLSVTGGIQEWLHGGIALAIGAASATPLLLFFNSDEKNTCGNGVADFGINALLLFAVAAEFAVFITEFNDRVIEKDFLGLDKNFLKLWSVSLSLLSASMYLGHEGQMFLKVKKSLGVFGKAFSHDERRLVDREKLFQRKFYLLSCLLNAGVHGVSRYPMLEEIYHDLMPPAVAVILAGLGASVSGLSRLATFSIAEEVDDHSSQEGKSRKYDARQRSKDIIYETCFILLVGLMAVIEQKNNEEEPYSHQVIVFACSALAATMSEVMLHRLHMKYKEIEHTFKGNDFFIDAIAAPGLGILTGLGLEQILFLLGWNKEESVDHISENRTIWNSNSSFAISDSKINYTAWISNSSLAVICTLILRHLLRKAFLPIPHAVPRPSEENSLVGSAEAADEQKDSPASLDVNGGPASAEESAPLLSPYRKRATTTQKERAPSCCEKISNACCGFFRKRWPFSVSKLSEADNTVEFRLN